MEEYKIEYEILDYDKFYLRLKNIQYNLANKNEVTKHEPIGYTKCGFPIEHYSIGHGPMHIVYMGGAHGNEIISVDYVTQLMQNIALGCGEFADFNPEEFTIDFLPCQNPEGFFTTTYALKSIMQDMNEREIEEFSKKYYQLYREDDQSVININKILRTFCEEFDLSAIKEDLTTLFWQKSINKDITSNYIISFLLIFFHLDETKLSKFINNKWQELFKDKKVISHLKKHQEIFNNLTLDCIPLIDEKHHKLKEALSKIYQDNKFPIGTLANFFSNASGVNLNDNNEYYFQELKKKIRVEKDVYANFRDNNLLKNIPGPVGVPNEDMDGEFQYAEENQALLSFLAKQDNNNENYAFINCHGTGGVLYVYPVVDDDLEEAHTNGVTRDFKFYINGRLANDYIKKTDEIYEKITKKPSSGYKTVGFPSRITGVGDVLRKKYIASFLLELSKMGGNPIAPYGDKNVNYYLTMTANMQAAKQLMETIKEVAHLYDTSYFMYYDSLGNVHYEPRKRR